MSEEVTSPKKPFLPKELTTVTRVSKLVALYMLIMLPIIGFYLGRNVQYDIDNALYSSEKVTPLTVSKNVIHTQPAFPELAEPFLKRQYKLTDKLLDSYNYPDVMNTIPDNKIKDMRCTDYYFFGNSNTYVNENNSEQALNDKGIQNLFNYYRNKYNQDNFISNGFQYCQTANGDHLVRYSGEKSEVKGEHKITYELTDTQGTSKKVYTIYHTAPDLDCKKMLLLTTDNQLYVQCHNGDTTEWQIIYQLDFNTGMTKEIYECFDSGNGGVATITPRTGCSYK